MKKLIPLIVSLYALGAVVGACKDPTTPKNIENAAAVAQYEALLTDCRAQGKSAGSYDVYEACAKAVDQKLCAQNGLRCADGGAN